MLDALYQKSIERKEEINNFFENITQEIDIEKVEEKYVNCAFKKTTQDKNFAAIDGSFNKTKYMAGYVYAITSQTIISKSNQDVQKESQAAEIKTISTIHNHRIDKILSTQMNIFELKSTIDTLKKHPDIDYMLMDGSLRGILINYQQNNDIPQKVINYLNSYQIPFENELNEENVQIELTSERYKGPIRKDVKELLKEEPEIEFKDIKSDIDFYLNGIEQLVCISYLLQHFKEKIICISKTSSTRSVFEQSIPDAAVIQYVCPHSGYTKPEPRESNRLVRHIGGQIRTIDYPVKNRELCDNIFNIFFTKLEDKSNTLKIEIPKTITITELTDLLNELESISIDGYPHILKKAHDEVKIGTDFMKRINRNIGLENRTGRDMLNRTR